MKHNSSRCEILINALTVILMIVLTELPSQQDLEKEYRIKSLINCAGLFSDYVAELAGFKRDVRIYNSF